MRYRDLIRQVDAIDLEDWTRNPLAMDGEVVVRIGDKDYPVRELRAVDDDGTLRLIADGGE